MSIIGPPVSSSQSACQYSSLVGSSHGTSDSSRISERSSGVGTGYIWTSAGRDSPGLVGQPMRAHSSDEDEDVTTPMLDIYLRKTNPKWLLYTLE